MINAIFSHAILSFLPGLIGLIFGFGMGYLIARELLVVLQPARLRKLIPLPWRTGIMALELAVLASPMIVKQIGIGTVAGWVTMGLALFLLAFPYSVSAVLSNRYPPPLSVKLFAGLRTLLIVSVALALIVGFLTGGGGAGGMFWSGNREQNSSLLLQGFLIVTILAFIVDIGVGVAQMGASEHLKTNLKPVYP